MIPVTLRWDSPVRRPAIRAEYELAAGPDVAADSGRVQPDAEPSGNGTYGWAWGARPIRGLNAMGAYG